MPINQLQDFYATVIGSPWINDSGGALESVLPQTLQKAVDNSKTTKQFVDIVAPAMIQFILVESMPGSSDDFPIGKSSLLQEMAYVWAKGQLLQKFILSNCVVQQ